MKEEKFHGITMKTKNKGCGKYDNLPRKRSVDLTKTVTKANLKSLLGLQKSLARSEALCILGEMEVLGFACRNGNTIVPTGHDFLDIQRRKIVRCSH